MIREELEREIALKELQLENYVGLKTEFDIKKEEDLLYMLRRLKPIALERYSPEPVTEKVAPFELPGVTTDWDFLSSSWALDTGVYVSPPSSLRLAGNFALLKQGSAGTAITNGRIETYFRYDGCYGQYPSPSYAFIVFRSNAPDGSTSASIMYFLETYSSLATGSGVKFDTIGLYLCTSGSCSQVTTRSVSPQLNTNTWNRVRVTWWVSNNVLVVRVEYLSGSDWVKIINDITENTNAGANSTTNRTGVGAGRTYSASWHDDTIIYVAV